MPVISFKVDHESASRIRANARAAKTSVSAYLRKAVLRENESPPAKIVRRKHPVSGLPCNAARSGRVISEDDIRAALANFP